MKSPNQRLSGQKRGPKPKNAGRTIARLLSYLKDYRRHLVLVCACIIFSAGASVAGTYFLKPLINEYVVPLIGVENPNFAPFIRAIGVMGAIYALGAASTFVYSRVMISVSTGTLLTLRKELFTKLESLPIGFFDKNSHGELMSRFTNDVDAVRELLSQTVPQFFSSLLTIIGVFTLMLTLNFYLTLLVFVVLALMLLAIRIVGGKSSVNFRAQQKQIGSVNGFVEEFVEGQKVIKVFCREENARQDFAEKNDTLKNAAFRANAYGNILMPIMGNLSYLHYALTAAIGGILSVNGLCDIGSLASFLQCTRNFSNPITQVSQQINNIMMALAGAERIFAIIDEQPETDNGYVTLVYARRDENGEIVESGERTGLWAWKHPHHDGTLTYTELKGDVQFEDVTFGYAENKIVLKNVSLYAKPGQKIAFVGSTGAGKTTITNLINRFYDVPDGKIRYDGININKIKKSDLRRSLAMVLQDTHLFTGTVMDNIRFGRLDATDEQVVAAAKLANADHFISLLPDGYNTMLTSDGSNLSQGQRQLLSIARAAVADPPVLILDEATSSIDTRTEALIERGMDGLMQGRTVFVIAHRLSTVRNSNAIMVLEHGEIIERGDHDSLILQRGKYYQLYTGAFELE